MWELHHEKITPNPPTTLFTLAENIPRNPANPSQRNPASLNAMTTDLAFELEGAHRHKLLAAQQLIVLGELLVERVLNTQPFTTQTPQP